MGDSANRVGYKKTVECINLVMRLLFK